MTRPVLSVTMRDGSRRYQHPLTKETAPSITTVIKGGLPKPALMPWAAKMAAEHASANWLRLSTLPHADRVAEIRNAYKVYADKTSYVGDIVHALIESWSTGRPYPEWPAETEKFVDNFIKFMTAKRPVFIESEFTVWSRRYGYAGTGDFIAEIDGRTILGDVKTGRRVYPEVGLQLSALKNADFILREDGTEEPLPEIDGLAALHVRPRSWHLIPVYEAGECFSAFLSAQKVMEWERDVAPNVLGG